MAYVGPMAGFRPTKEEMNSPGNPALFEDIVGIPADEWSEYMANQKNWTKADWKLHIRYVDAYGRSLMHKYRYCK